MASYSWQVNTTLTVDGITSTNILGVVGETAVDVIDLALSSSAEGTEIVSVFRQIEVTVDTRAETALAIARAAIDLAANPPGGIAQDMNWDNILAELDAALVPAEL